MRVDQLKLEAVSNAATAKGCSLAVEPISATTYDVGSHVVSKSLTDEQSSVYVVTLPDGRVENCSTLWEASDVISSVH